MTMKNGLIGEKVVSIFPKTIHTIIVAAVAIRFGLLLTNIIKSDFENLKMKYKKIVMPNKPVCVKSWRILLCCDVYKGFSTPIFDKYKKLVNSSGW